jgi:hypothetical protein
MFVQITKGPKVNKTVKIAFFMCYLATLCKGISFINVIFDPCYHEQILVPYPYLDGDNYAYLH